MNTFIVKTIALLALIGHWTEAVPIQAPLDTDCCGEDDGGGGGGGGRLTGILSIDAGRIPTGPSAPSFNFGTQHSTSPLSSGGRPSSLAGAAGNVARGAALATGSGPLGFLGRAGLNGNLSPLAAGIRVFNSPGGSRAGLGFSTDLKGGNAGGAFIRINLD